jgi:streptogramin lyase
MFHEKQHSRARYRHIVAALLAVAVGLAAPVAVPAAAGAATDAVTTVPLVPVSGTPEVSVFPTTPGTEPFGITAGPDGNIWYTEDVGPQPGNWQIGRFTFAGAKVGIPEGTVTNFSKGISFTGPAPQGDLFDMTSADGDLWATGYFGEVDRITTDGAASFQTAGITRGGLQGITADSKGNLWFTEGDGDGGPAPAIGEITPHGVVKEYSTGITPGSTPVDITQGPDGNLWFTEFNTGKIGRITPQGVVTEFALAAPGTGLLSITTDGGYLWVTGVNDNSIRRILPSQCSTRTLSCAQADFVTTNTGVNGSPISIAPGPDGNLWFSVNGAAQLGRITPQGHISTVFQGIDGDTGSFSSQSIAPGPDATLWFTEPASDQLGEVFFCSPVLCGGAITLSTESAALSGSLHQASTIGILVQRREHGRLLQVGRVPLGHHHAGRFEIHWNLRVDGQRLPAGRYQITLRALNSRKLVIDKTAPATITLTA